MQYRAQSKSIECGTWSLISLPTACGAHYEASDKQKLLEGVGQSNAFAEITRLQYGRCRLLLGLVSCCILSFSTGCLDGPMFAMKSANPYYQKQWKEDSKKGPVFADRQEEIRLVRKQLPTMEQAEQEKWTKTLADVYQYETSPELRRDAVLAISASKLKQADETLIKACSDPIDKVRIAACTVMAKRESPTAPQMLATLAQTDKNMSVRLAAIKSLGSYETDDAKSILRKSLDEKSPALQYEATLALGELTGKKYGGDVEAWRKFMDGESVPEPAPTIAETITNSIGIRR